jgi:hypothetical protein
MMEAIRSSETLVLTRATRYNMREDILYEYVVRGNHAITLLMINIVNEHMYNVYDYTELLDGTTAPKSRTSSLGKGKKSLSFTASRPFLSPS